MKKDKKIYTKRKSDTTDIMSIIKWLRERGERGIDFDFTGGDLIKIDFINQELEQQYVDYWGENEDDVLTYKIDGIWFSMNEIYTWLKTQGKIDVDYEFERRFEIGEKFHPCVVFKFYNTQLEKKFVDKYL